MFRRTFAVRVIGIAYAISRRIDAVGIGLSGATSKQETSKDHDDAHFSHGPPQALRILSIRIGQKLFGQGDRARIVRYVPQKSCTTSCITDV